MIVVVGAGITGLALGLELDRRGADYLVLEAADRPGGVIRSAEVDGRVLDWGPQRLRLSADLERLVDRLGLRDELIFAPPGLELRVYRDGRLRTVPFSLAGLLTSDVVSARGKLRLLLEPFTAAADPEERVAEYFRRKVGDEVYETIVAPLYGGLYGSDPADMQVGLSLIHVLRELGVRRSLARPVLRRGGRVRAPAACSLRGGMESLPAAMGRALGDRMLLETPVVDLRRSERGWRVRTPSGSIDAASVILTTPAPVTANLLEASAPRAADVIGGLRYNELAVVHVDAETGLRGLGFQVAFTEERALRGVTFLDSMFGRTNLYAAYLGGARAPDVAALEDVRLGRLAEAEFRTTTGYEGRAIHVERERMPAWDVSWRGLRDIALPEGLHLAANWWSRPGLPGRFAEARRVARAVDEEASRARVEARDPGAARVAVAGS